MIHIIVALTLIIIGIVFYLFPIARVYGNSMYPFLKEGDILICSRFFSALKPNRIYIFKSNKILAIKRLSFFSEQNGKTFCYFLGDNPEESYDSRDYGFINAEKIVAQLLWKLSK